MPHRQTVALAAALAALAPAAEAADLLDPTPRIAVMSAFAPEWTTLKAEVENPVSHTLNGTEFVLGRLGGKNVALFLSGVSMVNAAMTTQLALDHLDLRGIVFSGIAGGVDPDLAIGDVTVPAQWGQYLEMVFARKTAEGFAPPPWVTSQFPPYGMMYVRDQDVTSARQADVDYRFWFPVDPAYLATAERVAAGIDLVACKPDNKCLSAPPKIVVGGSGVSGAAFVDNAEFRDWAYQTFEAHVLDMESAAVAHVAYVNEVPFIAFRSLSDLAGGGPGENEMETFMSLAATNSAAVVTRFLAALD